MAALAKAKRQKLTRHVGVANFNIALLDQAIALCPEPLVTLQAEFHPYLDQSALLAACKARGLVITGLLSARPWPASSTIPCSARSRSA